MHTNRPTVRASHALHDGYHPSPANSTETPQTLASHRYTPLPRTRTGAHPPSPSTHTRTSFERTGCCSLWSRSAPCSVFLLGGLSFRADEWSPPVLVAKQRVLVFINQEYAEYCGIIAGAACAGFPPPGMRRGYASGIGRRRVWPRAHPVRRYSPGFDVSDRLFFFSPLPLVEEGPIHLPRPPSPCLRLRLSPALLKFHVPLLLGIRMLR